jgi:hypothetical protein
MKATSMPMGSNYSRKFFHIARSLREGTYEDMMTSKMLAASTMTLEVSVTLTCFGRYPWRNAFEACQRSYDVPRR